MQERDETVGEATRKAYRDAKERLIEENRKIIESITDQAIIRDAEVIIAENKG